MCLNPNIEEIFVNIFNAFSFKSPFNFVGIRDANIEILEFGPLIYITFQYNFSKNDGHEFKAKYNWAALFISLFDKSEGFSSLEFSSPNTFLILLSTSSAETNI